MWSVDRNSMTINKKILKENKSRNNGDFFIYGKITLFSNNTNMNENEEIKV